MSKKKSDKGFDKEFDEAFNNFITSYFESLKENKGESHYITYQKYRPIIDAIIKKYDVGNDIGLFEKLKSSVYNYNKLKQLDRQNEVAVSFLNIHGGIRPEFFTVPDNIVVVLLTPLNRFACLGREKVMELFTNVMEYLRNPEQYRSFPKQLVCLDKGSETKLFNNSLVVLPGQICNNMDLTYNESDIRNNTGNTSNPFCGILDFQNSTTFSCRQMKDKNFQTTLRDFCTSESESTNTQNQKLKILIFNSCRSIDHSMQYSKFSDEDINLIYNYETFLYFYNTIIFGCTTQFFQPRSLKFPIYHLSRHSTAPIIESSIELIQTLLNDPQKLNYFYFVDSFQNAAKLPENYEFYNADTEESIPYTELSKFTNTKIKLNPMFPFQIKEVPDESLSISVPPILKTKYFPTYTEPYIEYNKLMYYIARLIKTIIKLSNDTQTKTKQLKYYVPITKFENIDGAFHELKTTITSLNELIKKHGHNKEQNQELKTFLDDVDKLNEIVDETIPDYNKYNEGITTYQNNIRSLQFFYNKHISPKEPVFLPDISKLNVSRRKNEHHTSFRHSVTRSIRKSKKSPLKLLFSSSKKSKRASDILHFLNSRSRSRRLTLINGKNLIGNTSNTRSNTRSNNSNITSNNKSNTTSTI